MRLPSTKEVFNFEVGGGHTYFVKAGGAWLWVHNLCWPEHHIVPQAVAKKLPFRIPLMDETIALPPDIHNSGAGGIHGGIGYPEGGGHYNNWWHTTIRQAGGVNSVSPQDIENWANEICENMGWQHLR